jgi:hypothetical protein
MNRKPFSLEEAKILDSKKIIKDCSPDYAPYSSSISILRKLWRALLRLFYIHIIMISSLSAQEVSDSSRVLWVGDAIGLISKLVSPGSEVLNKERAVTIKIYNVRRKARMIRKLKRLRKIGAIDAIEYEVLMADLLGIKINMRK